MSEEETYEMEYTCLNCGTKHIAKVPKGVEAKYGHDACPYCGMNDRFRFTHKKPPSYPVMY